MARVSDFFPKESSVKTICFILFYFIFLRERVKVREDWLV